jgi:ubiquinone/menaquinone biosynthesis C-methylase UbiE
MGSAAVQSTLWGPRAEDWADVQESTVAALYESVLETLNVRGRMHVLDVGCGSGLFCRLATDRGATVSGIDATAMLLTIARRRVPTADLRQCDMEELPFAGRTFHVVTGFNAFQFAQTPTRALREASRVARPGGAVVMAVCGPPERMQATKYYEALSALLPQPVLAAVNGGPSHAGKASSNAPGTFALSHDGALQALAREAGLEPVRVTEVECVWQYPDESTALRGLLSAGPAVRAIQASGEAPVRDAVLKAVTPYRLPAGGYELRNTFRYLIAKA